MNIASDGLIGLGELPGLIKKSKSFVYKNWNSMRSYGLKVYKSAPNAHPRFDPKNVLETMMRIGNQASLNQSTRR